MYGGSVLYLSSDSRPLSLQSIRSPPHASEFWLDTARRLAQLSNGMAPCSVIVRPYEDQRDRIAVIAIWKSAFGYMTGHNAPELSITRKTAVHDGLFLVAESNSLVVGTVMAGYDGHRGWIYSLGVHPDHRKTGIGSALLHEAERRLTALGCVKVNLQVIEGNQETLPFYQANGYAVEKRISMGKRLLPES
jgi:ribosomal protein S18 acetylase RimI-like enzyme